MNFYLFLFALIFVCASAQKITSLPGYTGPKLEMYSGYVDVSETSATRNIFYFHIEALKNSNTAPLVFWFQGGPGCSGLDGLMSENGPFRLRKSSNGQLNLDFDDVTWLNFANMVWLESPCGVGFSYDSSGNYATGDNRTAVDNYRFLQGFIQKYPQYAGRDVWIAGESYAGVYLPTLANQIVSNPTTSLYKQFKGLTAGNPVFTCNQGGGEVGNNKETFNLLYWHALVSYSNYKEWTSNDCDSTQNQNSATCSKILNKAISQVGVISQQLKRDNTATNFPSLDPDCLYQDFCTGNGTLEYSLHKDENCAPYGNLIAEYFNDPTVQNAIHAQPTKWTVCSSKVQYNISGQDMVTYYDRVIKLKPSVKIMVYSGDVDILTVPFAYTLPCVDKINKGTGLVSEWQPYFVNGATAGYTEQYSTYTYTTLKGAGHEAPEYQPLNAYEMEKRFIETGKVVDGSKPTPRPAQGLNQGDILRRLGIRP